MTSEETPTKAQAMAEQVIVALYLSGIGGSELNINDGQKYISVVLRILNLEELLRDRDILDWIQAHHVDVKIFKGDRFETLYTNSMSSARSLRDAVTHEIASQQKEGGRSEP